ncbi:MAG TPA: hypothetical protein PLB70_07490, partial [Paludibacteraceae bacterium]|nr:hypothetical protein [Paludibacteraceae bacterium]
KSHTVGNENKYATTYKYDANGNILTLSRNDAAGNNFDNLSYQYERDADDNFINNRLLHVNDGTDASIDVDIKDQGKNYTQNIASSRNYVYDPQGNLIKDKAEQIAEIEWTATGKVKAIHRTPESTKPDLEFTYDALGNRVGKTVFYKQKLETDPVATVNRIETTHYVRDAQGKILATYTEKKADGKIDFSLSEQYLYGASRLGSKYSGLLLATKVGTQPLLTYENLGYSQKIGDKRYELTNHLGSVMAVVTDEKQSDASATVLSLSDYYPFGMTLPKRNFKDERDNSKYRFGFQSQEKESELWNGEASFFKYRISDNRLGKFFSVDPLYQKYPWNSSYAFSENRLIDGVELEGLEYCPTIPKFEFTGRWNDYISAIDNAVIDLLNTVPETWNSGVATVQSLSRGTYLSDLGAELKQTGTAVKNYTVNSYDYTVNTPISQQFVDAGKQWTSPQTLENVTTLCLAYALPKLKVTSSLKVSTPASSSKVSTPASETATEAAKTGWKVGEPITNLTAKGNVPAWSTVRQRFWKNEAFLNGSTYAESDLLRMQKGLAPQRLNPNTGLPESMELHHHIVPQRDGGLFDFMKVWPDEHRALDPFRK